jgi:hypothetical protein
MHLLLDTTAVFMALGDMLFLRDGIQFRIACAHHNTRGWEYVLWWTSMFYWKSEELLKKKVCICLMFVLDFGYHQCCGLLPPSHQGPANLYNPLYASQLAFSGAYPIRNLDTRDYDPKCLCGIPPTRMAVKITCKGRISCDLWKNNNSWIEGKPAPPTIICDVCMSPEEITTIHRQRLEQCVTFVSQAKAEHKSEWEWFRYQEMYLTRHIEELAPIVAISTQWAEKRRNSFPSSKLVTK